MTKEIILQGNKLIEEFVGREVKPNTEDGIGKLTVFVGGTPYYYLAESKYHEDWNILMPVVEKISEQFDVDFSSVGLWVFRIKRKDIDHYEDDLASMGGHEPIILNAWYAIVEFLKWYNKQPKYKKKLPYQKQ